MAPIPLPLESGGSTATPLEGAGGIAGQMGTISLGMLIQYINQRTYSDLLNLAEILPRKSDMEKKIDIVQFAQRTRQLYVRLLALVKWAASASKVDKCCQIMGFLEKQNGLFTDTADKLFHMTRESLVHARLPHFHIPAAVETLTTGSYDRLPLTIRQRILPPEPITAKERNQTLSRLEQIVRHRLVTTQLPPHMRTSKIENGRVRFTVEHEFEVSLTLMGDMANEQWRLLEIDILVDDKETGDGKALVHSMQVGYIHQLIQSRLQDHPHPLQEVYTVLHSFCQSLQLEVLYAQTLKLLEERLDCHIRIEEYLQGKSLTLTYWRELTHKDPATQLGYRLTIQADPGEHSRPLMLMHTPSLGSKESEIAERAIRSDHLSIERLLVHTIYLRTKARLSELKQELDAKLGSDGEKCQLSGSPAVLHVPILHPCLRSEQLLIAVDTHTGILIPHIPQYDNCPIMTDLQSCLNQDKSKLDEYISELRYWVMVRRMEKTLQHLPATALTHLPLMCTSSHPYHSLSKHKVFVTFHRHPSYIMIVEFKKKRGAKDEIEQKLYLMMVKSTSIENNSDNTLHTSLPKSYMCGYKLLSLHDFICTHGPATKIDEGKAGEKTVSGKRKAQSQAEPASKRVKVPTYFLPDVAHVVAMCDQIFPLAHISHELQAAGVHTGGVQVEEGGLGVVLKLISLPSSKAISRNTINTLLKHMLSCSLRSTVQQFKGTKSLVMEYIMCNCPLASQQPHEQGFRRLVYFAYEVPSPEASAKTVQAIISDWTAMAKLYQLVLPFAEHYNSSTETPGSTSASLTSTVGSGGISKNLSDMVRVHSFNYKSITLSYGRNFDAFACVRYSTEKEAFIISFGMTGNGNSATNTSSILGYQLEGLVNKEGDLGLVSLAAHLHHTYQPLLALAKLQTTLYPGINRSPSGSSPDKTPTTSNQHLVQIFMVIPQSPTRVRVTYRNLYCLEVDLLPAGLVAVRDGAFSSFHTSRVIEEYIPIQGLKAFLSKYVDENAISRRRSQSEDDNPPTPIPMDDSPWPTPKPSSPARHGPMTPPVSSNPHTPASPHPVAQGGAHGGFSSSPAASGFSLASPPSIPGMNPSPAAVMSHPSPGSAFLAGNSPSAQQHNVASPGFLPTPSPVGHSLPTHSPASSYLQGSTAASTPGGPVTSQVSRMLPNKTYAAAIPTILTHDAFYSLCSVAPQEECRARTTTCCVLEQFLGSTHVRRCLQQCLKQYDIASSEPGGGLQVKLESLIALITMQTSPSYCLCLKVQPVPEFVDRWTQEELQALEKFFVTRVACPPYRNIVVGAFQAVLRFPHKILRDCVRIMQLEMMPSPQQQHQMKWNVHFCLSIPQMPSKMFPHGGNAIFSNAQKTLFFLQLTRTSVQAPQELEPSVLVLPILYESSTNKTHVPGRTEYISDPNIRNSQIINEVMARAQAMTHDTSIFPCVWELLTNLVLGSDGTAFSAASAASLPVQQAGQQTQQQQQQQPVSAASSVSTNRVSPALSSPHLTSPHMSSPHTPVSVSVSSAAAGPGSIPTTLASSIMSSPGIASTSVSSISGSQSHTGPHYATSVAAGAHMQPSMGPSLGPQGISGMQGNMVPVSGLQTGPLQQTLMQSGPRGMQAGPQLSSGPPNMQAMPGGMQGAMQPMQGGQGNMQGGFASGMMNHFSR